MSHCMGVMCSRCEEILVPDEGCPERDCPGHHGFTYQMPNQWAATTWPTHACFRER